jgi:hypothetical protein
MKSRSEYRVKIKIGDAEVDVEGAQAGVVKIVEALSDVLRGSKKGLIQSSTPSSPPSVSTPAPRSSPVDIRSFFVEKQPSSDIEAAAVAAYFYRYLAPEGERRETIGSELLQEAFRLARRPLPARSIYTLQNARGAGYLDSTGEAGQFRLNAVGYNLVEHTLGASGPSDKRKSKPSKPRHKPSRKQK